MLSPISRTARRTPFLLAGLILTVSAHAADWPQFLGPNRNGLSSETGLIQAWPAGGPPELWRTTIGIGMSAPSIADGRLVTLAQNKTDQFVVVCDAEKGGALQRIKIAPAYSNGMGDGPRGTPAISDDVAYVFTGQGVLAAVDLKAGKLRWKIDTVRDLRGQVAEYGMACSPLLTDNAVVITVGSSKGTVAAYDRTSGKRLWTTGNESAGYSSSALLKVGGKQQIVAFTGSSVLGLEPKSGARLWRHPFKTNYECNIATPLAVDGKVFISAGENHGSALLSLAANGTTFDVTTVWSSLGPRSTLRSEWQTPIQLDGFLYGFDNVGGAGPISHLTCIESATGKRVWQQVRFGKGNLIAADGMLFLSTFKGDLVLLKANPRKFEELGRMQAVGQTRTTPVLANGLLYLRDNREVVCFDVRMKK